MTTAALTAAKAAATATAADLEAIGHRLEVATAAHAETSAELSAILAADAAGEAEAVAHDVAVLRSELDLRASRVAALKANHAKATDANTQAGFRLRAERLKASKSILPTKAVDALVEAASGEVEDILRTLAAKLSEGNEANAAAINEALELSRTGYTGEGLQVSGATQNPTVSVNGSQLVDFINVTSRLEAVGKVAAFTVKEELLAPARAARAAKEAADAVRDAKYKADLRAMHDRNTTRVDLSAL
ncbi:hypothetical protein [Arthrobacter sp. Y81]|uniref:hypothetical protein n=1 Tax=Arthrobacter sp. Y81 TaxID=2058897 RepID=UPI000CE441F5|nr:hypothetical protein [Arthrobacter sp. Y81]